MTPLSPPADAVMIRSANATGVMPLGIFAHSTPYLRRGAKLPGRIPLARPMKHHPSAMRRFGNALRRRSLPISVATDGAKSP
jgi:hypothetical protein